MTLTAARRFLVGVLVAAGALLMVTAHSAEAKPNVSRDLITPGTLLVGTDTPYPPFEFGKPPHYKGFDIDLVNAIARKLDLRVTIIDTAFDAIFMDLGRRKFDLLASAATITPERRRHVSFTKPNFDATQSLVVRRGSRIRSIRDLAGLKVGVQDGTTGWAFARDKTRAAVVVGYRTSARVLSALKSRRVDAAIIDESVARQALRRGVRGVRIAKSFSVGEKYAFAVRKGAGKLRRGINWAFARVKSEGKFKRIYRRWFHMNPPPSLRG